MARSDVLGTAITSVSANIGLEITLKVLTFLLRALCLRYVSTDVLGLANIRLFLMQQSIVFLSREPFRRSCIGAVKHPLQDIVNLVWFVPVVGIIYSVIFAFIWLFILAQPDAQLYPHYGFSVLVYASSAWLELVAEPCYLVTQLKGVVKPNVVIIGISTLNNCIITAGKLIYQNLRV